MTEPISLEEVYQQYQLAISSKTPVREVLERNEEFLSKAITIPNENNLLWLLEALKHNRKKWFVTHIVEEQNVLPEELFEPLMDAGINEVNPSSNKLFIKPCVYSFGLRRVIEYLLKVVEAGDHYSVSGAVNAMYWASPHFRKDLKASFDIKDLAEKRKSLFLEKFVYSNNVDVQRSLIPMISLNPENYDETYKALVKKAIEIGESHEDEYIRHRTGVQLGKENKLMALPYRKSINL